MRAGWLLVVALAGGCAPCEFDNGIVRGELTDAATGDPVEDGHVTLTSGTDEREVGVFGEGLYEGSVPSGTWLVTGWDAAGACFSAVSEVAVEPCAEIVVDLELVDCFR